MIVWVTDLLNKFVYSILYRRIKNFRAVFSNDVQRRFVRKKQAGHFWSRTTLFKWYINFEIFSDDRTIVIDTDIFYSIKFHRCSYTPKNQYWYTLYMFLYNNSYFQTRIPQENIFLLLFRHGSFFFFLKISIRITLTPFMSDKNWMFGPDEYIKLWITDTQFILRSPHIPPAHAVRILNRF